jgi:glycosyltransferase involved in cell wall biosynthesis
MKVIQIMPEFGLAGAEIMCENLTYELKKSGIEVAIISLFSFHSAITDRLEAHGIKIYYLNKHTGLDIKIIGKIAEILKSERPDCIHTHRYVMRYAIPAAIISGIKARVHTLHNIAQKENTRSGIIINRYLYKYCHVVPVALSRLVQDTAVKVYHMNPENIPVIFNGICLDNCMPKKDYSRHETFEILHIGRFLEVKNHRLILDAFSDLHREYPNMRLKLIGGGALFDEIQNYTAELGLESAVEFTGIIDKVYEQMHDADVFLLPSKFEGMPITLIEAMGTRLPIVASNVGGIPDMFCNEENALIIEPNKEEICSAIRRLYESEDLRKKLGENAGVRAKAFSSEEMADRYITLYENLIKQ